MLILGHTLSIQGAKRVYRYIDGIDACVSVQVTVLCAPSSYGPRSHYYILLYR